MAQRWPPAAPQAFGGPPLPPNQQWWEEQGGLEPLDALAVAFSPSAKGLHALGNTTRTSGCSAS